MNTETKTDAREDELRDAAKKADRALDDAKSIQYKAMDAAKKAVEAETAPAITAARKQVVEAKKALDAYLVEQAGKSPLIGLKVQKQEFKGSGGYRSGGTWETVYGLIEVFGPGSEYPGNLSGYSLPLIGSLIVRYLNKEGKPGKKIDRYSANWKSSADIEAAEREKADAKAREEAEAKAAREAEERAQYEALKAKFGE